MKKVRHYYEHNYTSSGNVTYNELKEFFDLTGAKLYKDGTLFYTYEFVGKNVHYFHYVGCEEVEIQETVVKLPTVNKYENGYNWKTTGLNARLRKANPAYNPYNPQGKLPINPRTGRRDGKQ
jgi:hypothetical protein